NPLWFVALFVHARLICELVIAVATRLLGAAGGGGALTVRLVVAEAPPRAAVIVTVPTRACVLPAMPCEPGILLIVATDVFEELQVTSLVTFWGPPTPKVAVAVNCWAPPKGIVGLAGAMVMPATPIRSVVDP